MSTPVITIFVRHSPACKYRGDEFCKRCNCRKHLRWTQNGKQYRKTAGTRSWASAENTKRNLDDQLAGRMPSLPESEQTIAAAVEVFTQDKKNQGISDSVLGKYTRELERMKTFCAGRMVFTVRGINRELLTGYCATWADHYPASLTRAKVRERLRSFLRFCYQAEWLTRIPVVSAVKVDQAPTLPLTPAEYTKLLNTVPRSFAADTTKAARVHALLQLMRWSGLAIRDALNLKRTEIIEDPKKKIYRVVTSRQKTGTHVSVPIPAAVALELLSVCDGNPVYVFVPGTSVLDSAGKNWAKPIAKVFEDAKIEKNGYMTSHRLRDTFAVDLLEKGVPLEEVSKALGHTSIKTTEHHYAKWVKGRQDRLDELVTSTWGK